MIGHVLDGRRDGRCDPKSGVNNLGLLVGAFSISAETSCRWFAVGHCSRRPNLLDREPGGCGRALVRRGRAEARPVGQDHCGEGSRFLGVGGGYITLH